MKAIEGQKRWLWKPLIIFAAFAFMYSSVLWKLGYDWWTDDNYSHGLLVPLVIGYIIWHRFESIKAELGNPGSLLGISLIVIAVFMLLTGTLASVLFIQRLSLIVMIAALVICFFGTRVLKKLSVPFLLFVLAIPVPQLIFNKVAFPLQLIASQVADWGIRLLSIPIERQGNVIDIPFISSGEVISLEVVEACSGIRSLMTLITLALLLGYFTREKQNSYEESLYELLTNRDVQRTAILMIAAVPIALITNAARVMITGVLAYYYGQVIVDGWWHDLSGTAVFLTAVLLLLGLNFLLRKILGENGEAAVFEHLPLLDRYRASSFRKTVYVFFALVLCGAFVNWFQYRGEVHVDRRPLREMPRKLGIWEQRNDDIRFDADTEKVLRASDYVMRDYFGPGKRLNLYVGYYASQRSGSTYHSPLSCLPGTGWEMTEPELMEISTPSGRHLTVNRYIVQRGEHKEYLIYWYQGRGRTSTSEYEEKVYTSLDSVMKRRSDGGIIRIMTPLGKDADRSLAAAIDLTTHIADNIGEFLPD